MTPTPTEIADSLRPCPFCGKADPRIYDGEGEIELDPMQWQIVCDVNNGGCGGSAKWSFTQADAIAAWNRRATSPDHRAAAEEIDAIMTDIYRQFKDWSKRKFSADDVTWCVVRAAVLGIIARHFPASPKPALAKEFDALAEKATQHFAAGQYAIDANSLSVWAPSLKGGMTKVVDIRGWGYFTGHGGGALALGHDTAEEAQKAVGDFIAWAFNHRTEISRALGGAVGDRYAEGYAAAREDAAKKMDEKAADAEEGRRANDPYTENRRYYEIRTSAFSDAATAIRALKPQGGEE